MVHRFYVLFALVFFIKKINANFLNLGAKMIKMAKKMKKCKNVKI